MIDPVAWLKARKTIPGWHGAVHVLGGMFRPFAEDPGPLSVEAFTYGLAHTYRFGGQTSSAVTVAEHVMLVAALLKTLWSDRVDLQRAGLMHDSVEAPLHDMQSPLRPFIHVTLDSGRSMPWEENDARLIKIIGRQYGIDPDLFDAHEVRCCDLMAAAFEQRDCASLAGLDLGLAAIPDEVAHLKLAFMSPSQSQFALKKWMEELDLIPS